MSQISDERKAAWSAKTRQDGFRRRNWPVVRRLGTLTVMLLLAGLLADLVLGSRLLAVMCWIVATVAVLALLVWFLDRRRFVRRPPAPRR